MTHVGHGSRGLVLKDGRDLFQLTVALRLDVP